MVEKVKFMFFVNLDFGDVMVVMIIGEVVFFDVVKMIGKCVKKE